MTAEINGNDLSDNSLDLNFSSGIRLFAIIPAGIPAAQSASNLTVSVTNNIITNNSFGVSIDAGFPYRADQRLWTGNFLAMFSGNTISGSKTALITFTRNTAAIFPAELKTGFKYLQDSTFTISDLGGDLNGYWFDHPAVDPIDGRILNNTLKVNGVTIPNGRNFQ